MSGADMAQDGEEQAFLTLINAYRAQSGAPALVVTQPLTRAASWFAADMANLNYFPGDHVDLLGRATPSPAWHSATCLASTRPAENILAGYRTAQEAINYWKNSPQHNENMLRPSFRAMAASPAQPGPGSTYGTYWATTFSTVTDGAAAAPPPAPSAPPPAAPPPLPACSAVAVSSNQQSTVGPNSQVVFTANPTCAGTPTVQWWGAYVLPNGNQLLAANHQLRRCQDLHLEHTHRHLATTSSAFGPRSKAARPRVASMPRPWSPLPSLIPAPRRAPPWR